MTTALYAGSVYHVPTLYEGYIVSVHRMVMENRHVDPGSIQGSHRPISKLKNVTCEYDRLNG